MSDWVEQVREAARRALPPVEGQVHIAGLRGRVEVIRDRWGVPHVYASDIDDLFFAQGFIIASERLFQLDLTLRWANGRLSTMFGDLTLPMDRFIRTIGLNRSGARVAAGYDDLSRSMTSAFQAGVHAWIDRMEVAPVEYQVLATEPSFPAGGHADGYWAAGGALIAWNLSGNWEEEILRADIAGRLGWEAALSLLPAPGSEAPVVTAGRHGGGYEALEVLNAAPQRPPGQGSNSWVVSGSRSESGKPLLANDPHLVVQMPSVWFECHLSAPGYEASGVSLPFSPGVVIGHTMHHAWGFTNVGGDTQDLYLERLSDDRAAAFHEGRWEPVTVHSEAIHVRGRDDPVVLEVRETRHGPILDSYLLGIAEQHVVEGGIEETYALRWTGHEHAIAPAAFFRLAAAKGFEEFRDGLRLLECPGQNVVYADIDGTIAYQCTGLYPVRRSGDGTIPVPGWTDEHEWDGYVPFEELPRSVDPVDGFLATANQRIHDDSYPHLIGRDFLPPFRARRIVELVTRTSLHTRETFAAMQSDTVSLSARGILPLLLRVDPEGDRQKEALGYLSDWDGDLGRDSVAAAVYEVWAKHIAQAVLLPRLGPELFSHYYGRGGSTTTFQHVVLPNLLAYPTATWFGGDGAAARDAVLRQALDASIAELTEALGEDMMGWRWGALHGVVFAGPLARIPGLADLFIGGGAEVGGDAQTISQSAFEPELGYRVAVLPSWRQIVDLADVDASVGVHPTGQSGNPVSSHWNDQLSLWSDGGHHPLPFTRRAVDAHAEATMLLLPG